MQKYLQQLLHAYRLPTYAAERELRAYANALVPYKAAMKVYAELLPNQCVHGLPPEVVQACKTTAFQLILSDPLNYEVRNMHDFKVYLSERCDQVFEDRHNHEIFDKIADYCLGEVTEDNIDKLNFLGSGYKPPEAIAIKPK